MNYYLALVIRDWGFAAFVDPLGEVYGLDPFRPFAAGETDMVYHSIFDFDFCVSTPPVEVNLYALAIAAEYDPDANMANTPVDAPFDLWHFSFYFNRCR